MNTWRDSARVVIGAAKRSCRAVVDMDKKRIEIHICPILMRTVRFIDGQCEEQCNDRDDCPIEVYKNTFNTNKTVYTEVEEK